MKKTLQECKEIVAKERGWMSWDNFEFREPYNTV